ncbi:MAG: hypothetical protein PHI64_12750 [Zoogloea sp.]|uniref:hypothetical protein n=1 Tax=Zoogloea sp. TaxID=49181 RepID=UPI00263192FE|nr:hypothetical protein [Zoogloea sp.]MDD2989818.1 hypothetical protein [Zoogloea sp.]
MQYAHLFNTRGGRVELYLTDSPELAGATVHSTYPNRREALEFLSPQGERCSPSHMSHLPPGRNPSRELTPGGIISVPDSRRFEDAYR